MKGFMKRIVLITITTALFANAPICLAQKSEPPAEPASGLAPGTSPSTSRARRTTLPPPVSLPASGYGAGTTAFSSSKGDSIPPVMIRFSQPDPKTSAGLEEDLFVMARVISRTLDRADGENGKVLTKMGVPMLLTGSGRSVRPMYIEGMGPLFMIKVSFPLLPPPKAEETPTRKRTAEDTEWLEAQRDVFGGTEFTSDETTVHLSNYNEEQVEMLKKELIGALKNAANMRGLAPAEFVNIAVFGQANSPIYSMQLPVEGESGGVKYSLNGKGYVKMAEAGGTARGTVLTLRAKKSDIDAFASGTLDAAGFKTKVNVTAYAGSGVASTSINSWIQEKSSGNRFQ
jgi:hypothetical protein